MNHGTPIESLFQKSTPNEESKLIDRQSDPDRGKTPSPAEIRDGKRQFFGTLLGSVIFLLYHVVFCLAQASTVAVSRRGFLGNAVLLAALGAAVSGPVMIWNTSKIPAVYPATDLFLAPFLARVVDEIIDLEEREFLTTFVALLSTGLLLSAVLCTAASRFRWANLTDFLPYPVLTGFFSTIGLLIWMLGFSVDTGSSVADVLTSPAKWKYALLHHLPSVVIGVLMHISSRRHSLFVFVWIGVTIVVSYLVLVASGTTLAEAQEEEWFFSAQQLYREPLSGYQVIWPFGVWVNYEYISWVGFKAGLPPIVALALLYLLRCSIHAAALKKNATLLVRENEDKRKENINVECILEQGYAYSHIAAAAVGSFAVAPSVAASFTMFQLGADGIIPQLGSCFLLIFFYITDFSLVQFIPKPAFSCLMVLAGLDISRTWLFESYFKTRDKVEWLVGPLLVSASFVVGLLNAIFLGIAVSGFLFIGNFHHAGIVKFVGTGLGLQSTVERGQKEAEWLEQNGDWIQILVLKNYLFFGNCKSVLNYVVTMFDEGPEGANLPPIPKFLVIDFSLVSGMDTSAVDLFAEIARTCQQHDCSLYVSGMSREKRQSLEYASVNLSHVSNLEIALDRAEESLLKTVYHLEEKSELEFSNRQRTRALSNVEDGFLYSLQKIDAQHGTSTADSLSGIGAYTEPVDLPPGDMFTPMEGSLYFIETGLLVIQPSRRTHQAALGIADSVSSVGHLNARSPTAGRNSALWKSGHQMRANQEGGTRLALIGQGWLIGSTEVAEAIRDTARGGVFVAKSACRLHCLSSSNIQIIEEQDPALAMHLYKTVAYLAVKRQRMTIRHLDQFVRILSTPAPRLRGGKASLAELQDHT